MIEEDKVLKAEHIRDTIESYYNTKVYRLIIEKIDSDNHFQKDAAKDAIDYANNQNLKYLLFITIPVIIDSGLEIVINVDLDYNNKKLSTEVLSGLFNNEIIFWDKKLISFNIDDLFLLSKDINDKRYIFDDKKIDGLCGSVINHCFYVAI